MDFLIGFVAKEIAVEKSKANFEYCVPEPGPQPEDEVKKVFRSSQARSSNGLNRRWQKFLYFFKPAKTLRGNKESKL